MTRPVLIGVGGSGQHVIHAYLRLLALTFSPAESVPHIFIVDADARLGAGPGKRSSLIDDIAGLQSALMHGDTTPAVLEIVRPFRVGATEEAASPILGQLIGVTGNDAVRQLAQGFLADDPDWGDDWSIELAKGMMANPKVGSLALAHKAEVLGDGSGPRAISAQFGRLFDVLRPDTRVAIVGSNFGGTGSGVIPALVRRLDGYVVEAVRAFLTLPWFTIEADAGQGQVSAARSRGDVDPKARNSSLGLHTYFDELRGGARQGDGMHGGGQREGLLRSAYVLSQSMADWQTERRGDDGNYDQRENPHVLNLVQACAIQNFLGMGVGNAPSGQLYGIKTSEPGEARGRFDAARSPHLRFRAGSDDSRQLGDLVADAEAVAYALDVCGRLLQAATDGVLKLKNVDKLGSQEELDRFLIALSEKLRKGKVTRGWLPRRTTAPDDVFHELGAQLVGQARELRRTLLWLDAHAANRAGADAAQANGVVGYSTAHLFRTLDDASLDDGEGADRRWQDLRLDVRNFEGQSMASAKPISQAIMLLMQLFTDGSRKSASAPVDALIAEFHKACTVDPGEAASRVAARTLMRALHRRVFDARDKARRKDSVSDDRQLADAAAPGGGLPMLNLSALTATPIEDARLAQIKLDDEDIGNVDRFGTDHPRSLAYLDPYAGANLGNGGRLDLTAPVPIEHGLRGIPNVAAPRLVQKWRLEHCRPRTAAERHAPAWRDDEGRLRATEAGIYLQAQRVNELGFWLLVSADSRVNVVHDLFTAQNRGSAFARLLRRELELADGDPLTALVFAASSPDAGKPILLWDGATWYAAANGAARRFVAALIGELPSVRRCYRSDNPLTRAEHPNETLTKKLDHYFARELHAVAGQIDADDLARGSKALTSLRLVLGDILGDLPAVSGSNAHRGVEQHLWLRRNGAGPASIRVAPHRMLTGFHALRCRRSVVFVDQNLAPNGLLPFRADAWELLEGGCDENRIVLAPSHSPKLDARSLALRRVQKIELNVSGLGRFEQEYPFGAEPLTMVQQELTWSFGIWPNFQAEDWNYYIVSGTSRLGDPDTPPQSRKSAPKEVDLDWMNEGLRVALVVKGRRRADGALEELGRITDGLPRRIYGRPEVLEVVVGNEVLGSRPIGLRPLSPGRSFDMLGIDFGTSNTCVAIQEKDGDAASRRNVPLLPGGTFGEGRGDVLFHYLDSSGDLNEKANFLSSAAAFFHVKNAVVSDDGDTVPSELLVALDHELSVASKQKPLLLHTYAREAMPLHDPLADERPVELQGYPLVSPLLTPLPPQPHGLGAESLSRWLRDMVRHGDERLFGDLKWPRGDDNDHRKARGLRALYLEHTLIAALALLRSRGYQSFSTFVATQPEALSRVKNNFAKTFARDLEQVIVQLGRQTGMFRPPEKPPADEPPVRFVSETVAALWMMGLNNPALPASVLTIDVGGGTTDVGVCLRFGRSGRSEASYTASAQFAGNRLLEALAALKEVRASFNPAPGETYSVDAIKSLLKSQLRRDGSARASSERTALLADMFFDAIYEYAFGVFHRFIQWHPDWVQQFADDPRQKLDVALLGNGFKLFDAFQAPGSGDSLQRYNQSIKQRLVKAGLLPAVVADRMEFRLVDSSKSKLIALGGLDAAREDLLDDRRDQYVLLPEGLVSHGPGGDSEALKRATLMTAAQFREQWMGLGKGEARSKRRLVFDLSDDQLDARFPLTAPYWSGRLRNEDVHNIFQSGSEFTEFYADPGALYLTGVPSVAASRSFAWLMAQQAGSAA